jgi:hypothetical protein
VSTDFDAIQPPIFDDPADGGGAPQGVCGRWLGTAPCGAAGTHHVIWDNDTQNGCICAEHATEIRRRWVYVGLHPYTAACASVRSGRVIWLPSEDRCVIDGTGVSVAEAAASRARS